MVNAWHLEDLSQRDSDKLLTHEEVERLTGVQFIKVDPANYHDNVAYKKVVNEKALKYEDLFYVEPDNPGFEEQFQKFLVEHMHEDEEVRLVLEGDALFDVRDVNDKWVRFKLCVGDLMALPAGIYHRGYLDRYLKLLRLFEESPIWKAVYRPEADTHQVHIKHVQSLKGLA